MQVAMESSRMTATTAAPGCWATSRPVAPLMRCRQILQFSSPDLGRARDIPGAQLIRRSEEPALQYEKIKTQYTQRLQTASADIEKMAPNLKAVGQYADIKGMFLFPKMVCSNKLIIKFVMKTMSIVVFGSSLEHLLIVV